MRAFAGAGKRKTPNVVMRTAEGEYLATAAPTYVDDDHHELEALTVPTFVQEPEVVAAEGGVRRVPR